MNAIFRARRSSISLVFSRPLSCSQLLRSGHSQNDLKPLLISTPVTSLITQFDELKQIREINKKVDTEATLSGSKIHDMLDKQMHYIDIDFNLLMDDRLKTSLSKFVQLSTAPKYGEVREVYLRAMLGSTLVRGYIDKLTVNNNMLTIHETKTTRHKTIPEYAIRLAYHQCLLYHKMLNMFLETDLTAYCKLFDLDASSWHDVREKIDKLRKLKVNNKLYIEFMKHIDSGFDVEVFEMEFDADVCEAVIKSRLDLLNGRRRPYGFRLSETNT